MLPQKKKFNQRSLKCPFQPFLQVIFSKLIRRTMQYSLLLILPISSVVCIRYSSVYEKKKSSDAIRIME